MDIISRYVPILFYRHNLPLPHLQNAIDHIAATCHTYGVSEAVICPGSRNAPLTIAFVRSGLFSCLSVADERSAGFIALGKALASKKPVVLICTSGSAVANFYPAVLEAFYQKVPLLVITADRPSALIDQWDGQTIRQENLFGTHVRGFWQTPESYIDSEPFSSITEEAILKAKDEIQGPVHINVPLSEPLYPAQDHQFTANFKKAESQTIEKVHPVFDRNVLNGKKILVLRGLNKGNPGSLPEGIAVYEDPLSMGRTSETLSELLFMSLDEEKKKSYQPDILLTEGTAILSKALKQFLRKYKPQAHYHFSAEGEIADPFQTNPELISCSLEEALQSYREKMDMDYSALLYEDSRICRETRNRFLSQAGWNEFIAISSCIRKLPSRANIHAANSMAIRYVAYCEPQKLGHTIYSNRGTSGIDGCVSTALGFQSMDKGQNYLFIGDVAFFYDSNAFWNELNKLPLKVILINNGGGGIFRLIDGPAQQPERQVYFESAHTRDAKDLCKNLGVGYFRATDISELNDGMDALNNCEGAAVLEIHTNSEQNQLFFNQFKSLFNGI